MVRAGFGNNNIDTCARVCHSPTGFGLSKTYGTLGRHSGFQVRRKVGRRGVAIGWESHRRPSGLCFSPLVSVSGQARDSIVIDPRRIDLVRSAHIQANYHFPLKPGTNVAVLNAIAHVVVD